MPNLLGPAFIGDAPTEPTDSNATPNAIPPVAAPPAPAQPQDNKPQPGTLNPDAQKILHHSAIGKGVKALLGAIYQPPVDYNTDDKGNTVAVPGRNKPGDVFRHILAGALLGAAASEQADPNSGFIGGFAKGAGARIQDDRAQDLVKRKQAQEQFENREKVKTDDDLITFHHALTAEANAHTAEMVMSTQGLSFKTHMEMVEFGKSEQEPYRKAGLQPKMEGITFDKMRELMGQRPEAANWDWQPTGIHSYTTPDGHVDYDFTYTAFEQTGKVPIPEKTRAMWKKLGITELHPELEHEQTIDAHEYSALDSLATQKMAQDLTQRHLESEIEKNHSEVQRVAVDMLRAKADMIRANAEANRYNLDTKKEAVLTKAKKALTEKGWDGLDAGDKATLLDDWRGDGPILEKELKDAIDQGHDTRAAEIDDTMRWREREMRKLRETPTAPKPPQPNTPISTGAATWYKDHYDTREAAEAAARQDGWLIPGPAAPPITAAAAPGSPAALPSARFHR